MDQLELVFWYVANESLIHVPPVQCVLKHCGAHKHFILYIIYKINVHVRDPKQS